METIMEQNSRVNFADEEIEIDLKELFFFLLRRWKEIFLAMLIGAAFLGGYNVFLMSPSYQADVKIYIANTDSTISTSDMQLGNALTENYVDIVKSRTVLNKVIEEMNLDMDYRELAELITVENPDSTPIIHIKVTSDDIEMSRDIANSMLNIGISQIHQIIGSSEPTIIDYAQAEAVDNVSPGLIKYLIIGALLGAFLVCGIEVMKFLMNTTMKSEDDVERYLQLPVLALVPYYKEKNI